MIEIFKKRPFLSTGIFFIVLAVILYLVQGEETVLVSIFFLFANLIFWVWFLIYLPIKFFSKSKDPKVKKTDKKVKKTRSIGGALVWILFISFMGFYLYSWIQFEEAGKYNTVESSYNDIVKNTKDEIKKCKSGESTYLNGLICPVTPEKTIERLLEMYSNKCNPYTFNENKLPGGSLYKEGIRPCSSLLRKNQNINNDTDVGFINLKFSKQNITFDACLEKPCNEKNNRRQDSIGVE